MPCARNSINNILTRANMHQHWWINDPDCLLIRPDSHLSLAEVQSLTTAIALTGGSVLLSDDLTKLPADRLHIAEVLLPIIGERARVIDWFDAEMPTLLRLDLLNETGEWHLVARFNWTNRLAQLSLSAKDFQLDEDEYWFSDFWNGSVKRLAKGEAYTSGLIPPHGCVMGIFRRERASLPQYLGSDLHYSQGKEVVDWEAGKDLLAFTLRLPRKASGRVRLSLPWANATAEVEGEPTELIHEGGKVWRLPLKFDGFVHVTVKKE
jgi:alpha-galactosidase